MVSARFFLSTLFVLRFFDDAICFVGVDEDSFIAAGGAFLWWRFDGAVVAGDGAVVAGVDIASVGVAVVAVAEAVAVTVAIADVDVVAVAVAVAVAMAVDVWLGCGLDRGVVIGRVEPPVLPFFLFLLTEVIFFPGMFIVTQK